MVAQNPMGVLAMKRVVAVAAVVALAMGGLPVLALEREGSIPEDLMAKRPPHPNDVYVAVLPFWGMEDSQEDIGRACVMLNLMRHGFRLAPKGSRSLAEAARRTESALRRDPKYEPLARIEPADAARVGKAVGAQWAIFGEFGDLRTKSEKEGGVIPRKVGVIDVRLFVVDVDSGSVLFWSRVQDEFPGGTWPVKATSVERRLVTRTINRIFDDIGAGMPEHYAGAEVTPEMVQKLLDSMRR